QCGARILPVNPQLPDTLLRQLLPSMTLRHALDLADESEFAELSRLEMGVISGGYAVPWDAHRLTSMTLTSGSSGLPKAAVHTPDAHLASAAGVLSLIPFTAQDD